MLQIAKVHAEEALWANINMRGHYPSVLFSYHKWTLSFSLLFILLFILLFLLLFLLLFFLRCHDHVQHLLAKAHSFSLYSETPNARNYVAWYTDHSPRGLDRLHTNQ